MASQGPWLLREFSEVVRWFCRGSQLRPNLCRDCKLCVQGSLLDNQELLDSLNHAKAKAATITASLQESQLIQVLPLSPSLCKGLGITFLQLDDSPTNNLCILGATDALASLLPAFCICKTRIYDSQEQRDQRDGSLTCN